MLASIRKSLRDLVRFCRQRPVMVLAATIVALYWPCLGAGYLMDDFVQLAKLAEPPQEQPSGTFGVLNLFDFRVEVGADSRPWWASEGIQTRFWRPLSSLLALLDHRLAPREPVWAHLHSVAWLIAAVAALRFLLKETCDQGQSKISWVALMTLVIFSLTCTHALPTLWIANRSALVATALAWCAIGCYARGQRNPSRGWDLLSALALLAALGAGEIAWVGVIQFMSFVIWGDPRATREKLGRLWMQALVLILWTGIYTWEGYGAHGGGFYLHPIKEFDLFIQAAPQRYFQLIAFALAYVPVELTHEKSASLAIAGVGGVLLLVAILAFGRIMPECSPNHQRSLRWTAFAGLLGLAPVLGTGPNDRLLVPAMLSTSFFFATAIRYLGQRRGQRICLILLGLGALRHFVFAPILTLLVNLTLAHAAGEVQVVVQNFATSLAKGEHKPRRMMLNSPDPGLAWSFDKNLAHFREGQGLDESWAFAAACQCSLIVRGISSGSIEIESEGGEQLLGGLYGKLFRTELDNSRDPLAVGKTIKRAAFEVEVLALDEALAPTKIRIDLHEQADGEPMELYYWDGSAIQRLKLPAAGQELRVKWALGPMGL